MQQIKPLFARLIDSFNRAIWHHRPNQRLTLRWLPIRLARTGVLAVRGFVRHDGPLRASALTFYTLLSLVPAAAMAFGIAKGFGFEKRLQQEMMERFAAQQEVVGQVIGFAQNMLDNTKGGMIAGIGIVVLFWAVIKVLSNIESAFNHIWAVRSRTAMRKLTDYLTIMLICPILVIMSGSITLFITSRVSDISGRFELLQMVGPAIFVALKLLPYALIWVLFTLIYLIMPNTRVRIDGAILAGFIAGSAYQALQAGYIYFQILVAKYNAIYGSFAALPLFLLWLQISWFIVLIGAEISHAYQHCENPDETSDIQKLSITQTKCLALTICRHVVQLFHEGRPAQTAVQMAAQLALAPALVDDLADLLVRGNILVRVENDSGGEKALQPARDIIGLTVSTVIAAIEDVGTDVRSGSPPPDLQPSLETLTALRAELDRSPANRRVIDLVSTHSQKYGAE